MIGKSISHYTITDKLGEGGMGIVYKAHDTKLDRTVALKFLPPHLTKSEPDKARFVQEAKAAAALNHNNVCTIFDIQQQDDQQFIVMEYVEGQTLKDKLKDGPLDLKETIDYAIQIAEALKAAHSKGIVHRDIKSENIMVTETGQVKVMDFGLAKLRGSVQMTKTGTTLGTIAYMSPEQARGEKVDNRSDIWSAGVILYEMLTGQRPFKGDYEQAVVFSILNEEPEPITGVRTGVQIEQENIVNKCLKKDPRHRYQRADELIDDLQGQKKMSRQEDIPSVSEIKRKKRYRASPLIFTIVFLLVPLLAITGYFVLREKKTKRLELKSIAVLPFANLRSDPNTDFLGFALADRIIGALTYIKSISVRPSSSVRQYENQRVDAISAGNDLKVDYILTGNYLKQANDIRLSVELVHVIANEMIWREPIEVPYKNAFTLQDIVSEKVIRGLRIQFSQDERHRSSIDVPQNPEAYEYYLRSISYPLSIEGHSLAIEMLSKSIQLDSTYADTFEELGFRTHLLTQYTLGSAEEYKKAEQFYLKALSLNSDLLRALNYLAALYTNIGRTEQALDLVRRALRINPNSAWTHFLLSYIYRYAGMLNKSEQEIEKSFKVDPNNPRFRSAGMTYLYLEKYNEALEAFDLDKESVFSLTERGAILLRQGQRGLALECFNRVLEIEREGQFGLYVAGMKAYIEGDNERGLLTSHRWEQEATYDTEILYGISTNYSLLGDKAGCVRVFRKVVEGGFFNYPFFLRDPFLDPVRDDDEFQRVLTLAKEKHQAFKKKYFPE